MKKFAVLGFPISHSLSPKIHQLFAKNSNIDMSYEAIPVQKSQLKYCIADFIKRDFYGLNITSPLKEEAYALTNKIDAHTACLKSVNTITLGPGHTIAGDNTDGLGFLKDLVGHHQFKLRNKRILVMGAGGSARGLLLPLIAESPSQIVIRNRSLAKAAQIVTDFACYLKGAAIDLSADALSAGALSADALSADALSADALSADALSADALSADALSADALSADALSSDALSDCRIKPDFSSFDLIINTIPPSQATFIIKPARLSAHTLCYDLNYTSNSTPFMTWAKLSGSSCVINGLGMLIEQAAESFYLWHRKYPVTNEIRKYLIAQHPI